MQSLQLLSRVPRGFISKEFRYLTFASKAEINAAPLSNQLVSSNTFIIYLK